MTANQDNRVFSGRQLLLLQRYYMVYGTLSGMRYGGGLAPLPEVNRLLAEADEVSVDEGTTMFPSQMEQESDPMLADYAQRRRMEDMSLECTLPESEILAELIRAKAERTVRKIVNKSHWLRESRLGLFLRDQPGCFLAIKRCPQFPKSTDKQIEFLARSIASVLTRYKPSTGHRYLASLVERCQDCEQKPALIKLVRDRESNLLRQPPISVRADGTHTAEQCRYSTWPCPIHHPDSPTLSGTPWCGNC